MANDTAVADMLDALSPLTAAGMDPDEASTDRAGTMQKLFGTQGPTNNPSWVDQAKAQQKPPVPGSVTQTGRPSLADSNADTIGLMQSSLRKASEAVDQEAAQPDLATTTAGLEARRNADATPINAYGADGKLQSQYKPSIGQRIARGIGGFARGGVLGVAAPGEFGGQQYGAPNQQYGRDVARQAATVSADDQQLKNAADNWKAMNDRLKARATEQRAIATAGKDVTGAAVAQQGIPIDQEKADTEKLKAEQGTPAGVTALDDAKYQSRVKRADQMGLKGQNRTLFLANDKIPDPRQATAEEIGRAQATAAWHRDNPGQQPGLDDIRSINAAVGGSEIKNTGKGGTGKPIPPATAARISDKKNAAMKVAQQNLTTGVDKQGNQYGVPEFVKEMNEAQGTFEDAVEAAGGTVDHMKLNDDGKTWTAESSAKPAQASSNADEEIPIIHPDGTPGTMPRKNLAKALKLGYKQPQGAK